MRLNDNFDESLIHIMLGKLTIQNDLTRNILRGKLYYYCYYYIENFGNIEFTVLSVFT